MTINNSGAASTQRVLDFISRSARTQKLRKRRSACQSRLVFQSLAHQRDEAPAVGVHGIQATANEDERHGASTRNRLVTRGRHGRKKQACSARLCAALWDSSTTAWGGNMGEETQGEAHNKASASSVEQDINFGARA